MKREILPDGRHKLILSHKDDGSVFDVVAGGRAGRDAARERIRGPDRGVVVLKSARRRGRTRAAATAPGRASGPAPARR